MAWIVDRLTQLWGKDARYRLDPTAANLHEAHYLKLDCSKAHMLLNWQPRWSLEQALEKICAWHQAQQQACDMRDYTLQQIHAYEAVRIN